MINLYSNRLIVIIVIFLFLGLFFFFENFYLPTPPEDRLVVAISPFYHVDEFGQSRSNIIIAKEIKEKIERERNYDYNVTIIMLKSPIRDKKEAEFQGRKVGAHLVIYGVTKENIGYIEEITYYILGMYSSEEEDSTVLSEKVIYSAFSLNPIKIINSSLENASSNVLIIGSQVWIKKGNDYAKLGKYSEALNAYSIAIKINPQDAMAWYNKGNVLVKLGRYEEAKKAFKIAYEFDPTFEMSSNLTITIEDLIHNTFAN